MKLFKKNEKAWEKWRIVARMIDLHKTKVIITPATTVPELVQQLPPWFCRAMLNAVPDNYRTSDPVKPDPAETYCFNFQWSWHD